MNYIIAKICPSDFEHEDICNILKNKEDAYLGPTIALQFCVYFYGPGYSNSNLNEYFNIGASEKLSEIVPKNYTTVTQYPFTLAYPTCEELRASEDIFFLQTNTITKQPTTSCHQNNKK